METVLYRSGKLPEPEELVNKNAVWFDNLAPIPPHCSPRAQSVFACATFEDALGWVNWRLDRNLDADIWAITIPSEVDVYAHPVEKYENSRFVQLLEYEPDIVCNITPVQAATDYWMEATFPYNVTPQPNEYWEVLIPHTIAVQSVWELVHPILPTIEPKTEVYNF